MIRFGFRELVLLIVLMALPLSSYWLVFRPQNNEITQAKREIEHKKSMLEKLTAATAKNEDLERANEEIKADIAAIEARLPTNKEVDDVVRHVSELAGQSSLEAPTMESQKPVSAAMYMEQPLKMSVMGDFRGFYEFLVKVEQLPRITRMPDLHLSRANDKNGFMKAEYTLSIYFQQETSKP